jgi:hypothetical protein
MKKKLIKLSIDTNFSLIGIATWLSAHKLGWLLNTQLETNFKQVGDLLLADIHYAVYEHNAKSDLTYKLIENKNKSGTFIKKLNNIDYLLKVEGDFSEKHIETLVKRIRETDNIIACLSINNQNLKQKELDLLG